MKLLIITQKADRTDPILGFFHRWIEGFASQCDSVTVIAQHVGTFHFPPNVTVLSLGKESGRSKVMQIVLFWWLIWKHRKSYDRVLVHMTPIWVILGWKMWFLLRKPVYLWYEIRRGSFKLSLALLMVRKVFSATAAGLPGPSLSQVVTGHGIDTQFFEPMNGERDDKLIVSIGRITRSKRYDVILRAFAALPLDYRLEIAGGTITASDESELLDLQTLMRELGILDRISIRWIAPTDIPAFLRRASLMLHACVGGLDKAVLEAMACGVPVISCSEAAKTILPESCFAETTQMAEKAQRILLMTHDERARLAASLRQHIVDSHDVVRLIGRLVEEMR